MYKIFEFRSLGISFDLQHLRILTSTFAGWTLFIALGSENDYFLERELCGDQLEGGQILRCELSDV